jgi:hypothetical protein
MEIMRMVLVVAVILASVIAVSGSSRSALAAVEKAPVLTCADLNAPEYDGLGGGDYAPNLTLVPGDTVTIVATPVEVFEAVDKSFANVYARAAIPQLILALDSVPVASADFPNPGMVSYTEPTGFSGSWMEWYLSNEGYADWDVSCEPGVAAGCDMYIPLTADAVVGAFVADANVYWAPGMLTAPLATIGARNTAWVLGVDATGQYYKIVWVCQLLWVPVGTMGPNFDQVWNGKPLPTSIVH